MVLSALGVLSSSGEYAYEKCKGGSKENPKDSTKKSPIPESTTAGIQLHAITGVVGGNQESKEENAIEHPRRQGYTIRRSSPSPSRNSLKISSSLRMGLHAQTAVYDALIFFILLLLSIIVLATIVRSGVWAVEKEEKDYSLQFNQDIARVILATTIPRAEWTEGGEPVVLFQKPVDHLLLEELYVMRNVSGGGDFSAVHYQIYSIMKNLTRPSYRFCIYAHEFMTGRQFTVDDDVPLPPTHYGTRFMYDMLDKYGTAEIVVYTWQP